MRTYDLESEDKAFEEASNLLQAHKEEGQQLDYDQVLKIIRYNKKFLSPSLMTVSLALADAFLVQEESVFKN